MNQVQTRQKENIVNVRCTSIHSVLKTSEGKTLKASVLQGEHGFCALTILCDLLQDRGVSYSLTLKQTPEAPKEHISMLYITSKIYSGNVLGFSTVYSFCRGCGSPTLSVCGKADQALQYINN